MCGSDISQFRARVGCFHCVAVRKSKCLFFLGKYDVIPFILIACYGARGVPAALSIFLFSGFFSNIETALNLLQCNCELSSKMQSYVGYLNNECLFIQQLRSHSHVCKQVIITLLLLIGDFQFCNLVSCTFLFILLMKCGDVHPNPGPASNESNFSIVHNNICSLENKVHFIEAELNHFDIITLSETCLNSNCQNEKIELFGYHPPVRRDRQDRQGGGVAIYVKKNLICVHRPDLEVPDLEAVWIETKIQQQSLLIGSFYRAPDARVKYWELIDESIQKAGNTPLRYIILGDFNSDNPAAAPHLKRILNLNNLFQLVTEPTRVTDNTSTTIDLIITPCPDIISKIAVLPPVKSDHRCPYLELTSKRSYCHSFKRTLYNYSKLDVNKYINLLENVNWNNIVTEEVLDNAVENFSNTLLRVSRECMPSKTVNMRDNDAPWITYEIKKLKDKKQKSHITAKRLNSAWAWQRFRTNRNLLTDTIRKRKEEYLQNIEDRVNIQNNFGSKDWWKLVKGFSSKKGINNLDIPPIRHDNRIKYSPKEKSEAFNEHFIKQSELIGIDDNVPNVTPTDHSIPPLEITSAMINEIIKHLEPNKAAGPDEVHHKILIKGADIIAQPLAFLFNRSLDETVFPKEWKKAHVTPIYKKGEKYLCTNYRPISLLSCLGKVMERCVQKHVFNYLKSNHLLTTSQSGFIPKDSTAYQLLVIYDDFCKALDNKITCQAVFFDISKAFDRVWHAGLIRKLYAIGIRGNLLCWFKNYLSERIQAVVIKGEKSHYLPIHSGVPQGSVLGPLLFLIYINDIVADLESTSKLFADDTSIYLCLDDVDTRSTILNSDMLKITNWATKWKVYFNPAKTELMTISNKRETETKDLFFGNIKLVESLEHKHLGVIIQNNCKWDSHIHSIITKVRLQVACLRSYKYKLNRKTLETMYKAFILPHFDYADVVWDNCTDALSEEIEKLNLDSIRTIIGAVRGTSHNKLYEESGLLPLKERRRRHRLLLFFKIIKGMTPEYLTNLMPQMVSDTNPYHFRNRLERQTPRGRLELYKNSFFPSTTTEWNNLPDFIKEAESITQFKKFLAMNDVKVPLYYYINDRFSEIIHCKIRLEISDLNGDLYKRHLTLNKTCACGNEIEDAHHFFFECRLYHDARQATITTLSDDYNLNTHILTHGIAEQPGAFNKELFKKVQEFIKLSKRFA